MTLVELVQEVHEKTHLPMEEILDLVQNSWPGKHEFTPTQCALVVNHINRCLIGEAPSLTDQPMLRDYTIFSAEQKPAQTLTEEEIWGEA